MSMPCSGTVSKTFCRNSWRQGWMPPVAMRKTVKGICRRTTSAMGIPQKLKSQYDEFQIDVPRNRNGEFKPKLIPKYQRDICGIEEKVISLHACGMDKMAPMAHQLLYDFPVCVRDGHPGHP